MKIENLRKLKSAIIALLITLLSDICNFLVGD